MQEHYAPYAMQWENEGAVPEHVYGKLNIFSFHCQNFHRTKHHLQANGAVKTCSSPRSRRHFPLYG